MKCSECGAQISSGVRFCTSCGTPVLSPDLPAKCKCGAEFAAGLKFCTQCGEKVEPSAKKEVPPVRPAAPPTPTPAAPTRSPAPSPPAPEISAPVGQNAPGGSSGSKVVVAVVVLLIVAGGGWFMFGQSKTPATSTSTAAKELPAQAKVATAPQGQPVAAEGGGTGQRSFSPSFDCSKASARNEKLVCADEELAVLDAELGKLYAQAKASAVDPAAFKQESRESLRNREKNCAEKACLLEWYAERKIVLSRIIESGR